LGFFGTEVCENILSSSTLLDERKAIISLIQPWLQKPLFRKRNTTYNQPVKIYFHLSIAGNFKCLLLRAFSA